uniref:Tripartite motif containing 65 n=1 Tax=Anas platyrhynchos TaxID=8839 RepID=A0A8B9T619_ANAPL
MRWKALEEKLVCSICLELFKVPITLPCGHNFCKCCISDHQGKQEQAAAGAKQGFSCPECRQSCAPQLELKKNVTLSKVLELVRASTTGVKPLELYCEDEQRCICCVCTVQQCQRHRRALLEDVHSRKQVGNWGRWEAEQGWAQIGDPEQIRPPGEKPAGFPVPDGGQGRAELSAALRRVEENSNTLKGHLDTLRQHQEQARDLLVSTTDHRTFLEVPSRSLPRNAGCRLFWGHPVGRRAVSAGRFGSCCSSPGWCSALHSLNRSSWSKPGAIKVGPSISAPRVPFLSPDHRNLTFDPDTANKYLELSKGQRRARHGTGAAGGWQERGSPFEPWQVLCGHLQPLRHPGGHVPQASPGGQPPGHKFSIGLDGGSWGLQVREDGYLAWHKGQEEKIQERLYTQLGVRLDYGRGLLSFYGLGEETRLIHCFHAVFTEPLYPVFWLCEGRAVTLGRRDQPQPAPQAPSSGQDGVQ